MSEVLTIFDFSKKCNLKHWHIVNDEVMGGISMGLIQINQNGNGVFSGHVSLENNGGFSLLRHDLERIEVEEYSSFEIRLKGDGKKYQFRCKSSDHQRHSYIYTFNSGKNWKTITIPFEKMQPVFRGGSLELPNFKGDFISQIALLIGNNIEEDFSLDIDYIKLK
ncbi:CIA30 family protein [Maribacter sp. ACAM166]|uniref:CIA30 family protein n=1 Tax=Maribacter sp. ACAM166 TaxID=2508996 RepID=UPI0010FD4EBA|nr:CIA30 family protein [Maribacter sp. ACAM166]TLP80263.1 CIA30 family protein [Maribacter sp. ACAM166]